ncbi:MAG: ATP-binding cassette domain-containing protein [Clostridiales bacterium]|nr:ATP-binding cassette domain-containing protein [Candidatus Crickella merdequi]
MIKLEKVNKYFNKGKQNQIHVIDNTTMKLPGKGIVTLLGPSGCGKTTLLNVIGGLDRVDNGKIYIDEDCITGERSGRIDDIRNARIGYIFQNFNLLDDRTVFENVAIALRMVGIRDKQIIEDRVNYCLKAVGIYQYRFKNADALSGGQRQRVAIARAIVKNPRIIIADEPTGNLDSANTLEVMNIIKTVSRDRLVLLVTHEKKIAEFYSDHICEIKDGKIIKAYNNDSSNYLDYQLENKLYLKDMPMQEHFENENVRIGLYGENERTADIKIVLRGSNLYIDTGGVYNVVDETSKVELIDDHYSMMDASIYEDNSFEYDAHLPEDFKARYTSLYTPLNLVAKGFRTMAGFKKLKKALLIGFVFAAMFAFLGVSNILGIIDVKASDFLQSNDHYVTVANTKHNAQLLEQAKELPGCTYVLPGNSRISVGVPLNDYLQTTNAVAGANVSLTYASTIGKNNLYLGELPANSHEVVIDKMVLDKFFKNKSGVAVGLVDYDQFIGRIIKVGTLSSFKIVGISDTDSPSLYAVDQDVLQMVINGKEPQEEAGLFGDTYYSEPEPESEAVVSYDLRDSAVKLKKGKAPSADYEVIVHENHDGQYELNKTIDKKVNGQKLKVVGFYTGGTQSDTYYVTTNTTRLAYIGKVKNFVVYSEDPDKMKATLDEAGFSSNVNYNRDKETYIKQMMDSLKSSMAVAAILLAVSLIEMYLMLRSSFLARIKEVGTMRAIGLKKKDIYRMFAGEILAITVVTSIPGIAVMYYIMTNVVKITSYLESLYLVTPVTAVVTFCFLILFNLLVGLIPVFRTMRKTPAEILARTDI